MSHVPWTDHLLITLKPAGITNLCKQGGLIRMYLVGFLQLQEISNDPQEIFYLKFTISVTTGQNCL